MLQLLVAILSKSDGILSTLIEIFNRKWRTPILGIFREQFEEAVAETKERLGIEGVDETRFGVTNTTHRVITNDDESAACQSVHVLFFFALAHCCL